MDLKEYASWILVGYCIVYYTGIVQLKKHSTPNILVFAFWPVLFVFVLVILLKYVVLFLVLFSYFIKSSSQHDDNAT